MLVVAFVLFKLFCYLLNNICIFIIFYYISLFHFFLFIYRSIYLFILIFELLIYSYFLLFSGYYLPCGVVMELGFLCPICRSMMAINRLRSPIVAKVARFSKWEKVGQMSNCYCFISFLSCVGKTLLRDNQTMYSCSPQIHYCLNMFRICNLERPF